MNLLFRPDLLWVVIKIFKYFDLVELYQHFEFQLVHFVFGLNQLFILSAGLVSLALQLIFKLLNVLLLDGDVLALQYLLLSLHFERGRVPHLRILGHILNPVAFKWQPSLFFLQKVSISFQYFFNLSNFGIMRKWVRQVESMIDKILQRFCSKLCIRKGIISSVLLDHGQQLFRGFSSDNLGKRIEPRNDGWCAKTFYLRLLYQAWPILFEQDLFILLDYLQHAVLDLLKFNSFLLSHKFLLVRLSLHLSSPCIPFPTHLKFLCFLVQLLQICLKLTLNNQQFSTFLHRSILKCQYLLGFDPHLSGHRIQKNSLLIKLQVGQVVAVI